MGLTESIFRSHRRDCTNGGASATADSFTIINIDGPSNPTPTAPAAVLKEGNLAGTAIIVPVHDPAGTGKPGHVGPMMGGNYAASCDSRFRQAVEAITESRFYGAIAVHDRYERTKEHHILCD